MLIEFVEIQNFRKLKSVRIDFSQKMTLLVGANNSGKTSALVALGHFLVDHRRFTTKDFTLSTWAAIDAIGERWVATANEPNTPAPALDSWEAALPSLDVWLSVAPGEYHYVQPLLPDLDWTGGMLGVRVRFEPKSAVELQKEYLTAIQAVKAATEASRKKEAEGEKYTAKLWPESLRSFLDRKLASVFTIRSYLLDPANCKTPVHGIAQPQSISADSDSIDGNPLARLICVDEIEAQRGLGDPGGSSSTADGQEGRPSREQRKLSDQLRSYYARHLDPSEFPEAADLDALEAIARAQTLFDGRLKVGFANAIKELESLSYPGMTDPKLTIATKMRPTDGLKHNAAVQYEVASGNGGAVVPLRLPEEFNGLGYQNLISIVFKLMSFRDDWMRVGKVGKARAETGTPQDFRPPLHLVLLEEPEAHLHAQVQQVFVRKAYDVLRNHPDLKDKQTLRTQLLVSTHSSHVAHEATFSCLRYFRRLPATSTNQVPHSAVINLTEVFGTNDETEKFAMRYLRATHCDLFFADAAIMVEGPAERILLPHFMREHFEELNRSYITLLEIGGSHAHRLRRLIEYLGLLTLIVTDVDSCEPTGRHPAVAPTRGCGQLTRNATLKGWHPRLKLLDDLLDVKEQSKVMDYPTPLFAVRVAYQSPMTVAMRDGSAPVEALATTFEDALVFENLSTFRTLTGEGMLGEIRDAVAANATPAELSVALFEILKTADKAGFALDILAQDDPGRLKVPGYIHNGLTWLQEQLRRKQLEVLASASAASAAEPAHV